MKASFKLHCIKLFVFKSRIVVAEKSAEVIFNKCHKVLNCLRGFVCVRVCVFFCGGGGNSFLVTTSNLGSWEHHSFFLNLFVCFYNG